MAKARTSVTRELNKLEKTPLEELHEKFDFNFQKEVMHRYRVLCEEADMSKDPALLKAALEAPLKIAEICLKLQKASTPEDSRIINIVASSPYNGS